jgi:WD40 repeat protein
LYIADTKNGETYWDLTNKGHIGVIHNLCFTPDEKYLVSMDPGDVTIRVWDIKARKPHASFRFCGERGSNLWSNVDYVETAKHVFHIDVAPDFSKVAAEYGGIEGSTLTPDGKLLVVAGNTKGKIPFLDLRTGKAEKTIQLKRGRASRLHFTPDGKWLVAGVYYKTDKNESRGAIEIWDMEKQKQITSLGEHESRVTRIAISPDKKTIVSGGSMDGFRVWDVITGKQKFSYFTKDDPRLPRVKVSPDTPDKPFIQHSTMAAGCAFLANGETFIIVPSWSLWNTEVYFHETATGRPVDFRKAVKELKTPKN